MPFVELIVVKELLLTQAAGGALSFSVQGGDHIGWPNQAQADQMIMEGWVMSNNPPHEPPLHPPPDHD